MIWKIVAIAFALLSVAFFARFVQFGYKWLTEAPAQDVNYKALTIWSLVYVVVCAAIAWVAARLKADERANDLDKR